jgi:S-adenosylmethionine synthetase
VTIEYDDEGNNPKRVAAVVISSQHEDGIDLDNQLAPDVKKHVIDEVLAQYDIDSSDYELHINPTGKFVIGGPMGDAGLTGRKIIVDTYGGYGRHGGGAFSGKDPSKVDRSAAYTGRWVAKNIVAAGLASKVEVQLAYAIGVAHPVGFYIDTYGTETVPLEKIYSAVKENFDLRPAAIVRDLDLKRPIYKQTAAYGHFGRAGLPWEDVSKAEALKASANA